MGDGQQFIQNKAYMSSVRGKNISHLEYENCAVSLKLKSIVIPPAPKKLCATHPRCRP